MIIFDTLQISHNKELISLAYFVRPGSSQETLLYIHGLGCAKDDFLKAVDYDFLKKYTLFAFDWPGSGESSYPARSLNLTDIVEITELIFEKLNLNKSVVIGHSMGGVIAMLYSQKYSNNVQAFINVEGSLGPENAVSSVEITKLGFEKFKNETFDKTKQDLKHSDNFGFRTYAEILNKTSARAYFDYSLSHADFCQDQRLLAQFINLKMPKVFIYGSQHLLWQAYIPRLKQAKCSVVEILDSHHFPQYDNPDFFYSTIAIFLKSTNEGGCI